MMTYALKTNNKGPADRGVVSASEINTNLPGERVNYALFSRHMFLIYNNNILYELI